MYGLKDKIIKIISFFKESYTELRKVSWLSKKELIASTILVVIAIFIFSIYIGIVDLILSYIVGILLRGRI